MLGRQERNRLETGLGRRLIVVVLFLLSMMLGRSVWLIYSKFLASQAARDEALAAVASLETRAAELETKVKNLATPRGQEAEIRQKLPVVKEGEKVIVIIDETKDDETEPTQTKSWWQNIWSF